jgi:hypothetical protein
MLRKPLDLKLPSFPCDKPPECLFRDMRHFTFS